MYARSHPLAALACGLAACQLWLPLSLPAAAVAPEAETEAASPLKARFPDTASHAWAETAIDRLSEMGVIKGFPDGTFGPGKPVTRAEFAAMVSEAFYGKLSAPQTGQTFPDTRGHWAHDAVSKAYALGFISGYPDGNFRPQGDITRLEAIVALASGLTLQGDSDLSRYTDAAQIPPWALSNVKAATFNNIVIEGPNANQFRPAMPASRADVAVFIYQALQRLPAAAEIQTLNPPQQDG
ncbi:MAG TPA: S-layer homology domain-containing protein, partial [Nodosilinea sp.]|nr:S-layer homology domain-containing protein [Nodosilinea sp.]